VYPVIVSQAANLSAQDNFKSVHLRFVHPRVFEMTASLHVVYETFALALTGPEGIFQVFWGIFVTIILTVHWSGVLYHWRVL